MILYTIHCYLQAQFLLYTFKIIYMRLNKSNYKRAIIRRKISTKLNCKIFSKVTVYRDKWDLYILEINLRLLNSHLNYPTEKKNCTD